jgi:hypothetical protein
MAHARLRALDDNLAAEKETLQPVRVLLVGMSNMLSDILMGVLAQVPDCVVAGNVGEGEDLAAEIRTNRANALILQSDQPGTTESFAMLLRRFPALKVVAIDTQPAEVVSSISCGPIPFASRSYRLTCCTRYCARTGTHEART